MIALRVVGGVLALALLIQQMRRYSRRNASRLNLIITFAITVAVVVMAIQPNWFNFLFDTLRFKKGNNQRLIGALLIGEIVLFTLVLRNWSEIDVTRLSVRHLVESLAVQSFDWQAAKALPDGRRLVVVLPAFNEAENVGAVIHAIPEEVEGLRVVPVVVDDGSEDATVEVARAAGALVARHPIRRGGGPGHAGRL